MDGKKIGNRVGGWMEKAITIAGIGFCLLAASIFFYTLTVASDPYSPLGPYPDQNVISDLRVDGLPAFRPHELVTVEGRKCVQEDVEVYGTQVWQSVDPAAGNPYPVWKITGIETPINVETGENGETLSWETEPFVLVGEVGANP